MSREDAGQAMESIAAEEEVYKYPELSDLSLEAREFLENFSQHILYEDDDIIAINKPANIPVQKSQKYPAGIKELTNMACGIKTKEEQISPGKRKRERSFLTKHKAGNKTRIHCQARWILFYLRSERIKSKNLFLLF